MLFSGKWGKMIHEKNLKQKSRDTVPLNNGCFLFIFSNGLQEGFISYLKPSLSLIQIDHVDIHLVTFPCQWLYQLTDLLLVALTDPALVVTALVLSG